MQKYNVARQYNMCMTSQIVWSKWKGFRESKMCAQLACCPCLSETVCSYLLYVIILF